MHKTLCINLVNYWEKYTEMYGQQNVKIRGAKQAKQVIQYKNTKKICAWSLVNYWDKYTEMHGQQNVKI